MTSDGGIDPVTPKETIGRGVGFAADRGSHADAVGAAGFDGANQAGGTVCAVRAGSQPCARGTPINAVSGFFGRAGAHAVAAGTAWPECVACLPRARVTGAGSLGADAGGTLTGGNAPLVYDTLIRA